MTPVRLRILGTVTILLALIGLAATFDRLGQLFYGGGLTAVGMAAGGSAGFALIVLGALDVLLEVGLLAVGVGLLRLRQGVRLAGLVLGLLCMVLAIVWPAVQYFFLLRDALRRVWEQAPDPVLFALFVLFFFVARYALWFAYGAWLALSMHRWGAPPRASHGATAVRAAPPRAASPPRADPTPAGRRAATNAPRHWPAVYVDHWLPQMPAYNQLGVLHALLEGLKDQARPALAQRLLYDDGIVGVPLVIEEAGRRTAVLVYPEASPGAAAHYSGMRSLLRQREGMQAVYYAPAALLPAAPAQVVVPLDTPHFSRAEQRPPTEYALWWPTPDDPLFASSPALAHLDSWFEALDGYGYVLLSSFAKELDLLPEQEDDSSDGPARLVRLPAEALVLPVNGPANLQLCLHASRDEGLWLAFDTARTSGADRNRLLGLLARLARELGARRGRLPVSEEEQARALDHWRRARQDLLEREAAGVPDLRLGAILESSGGLRVCLANVSTAEERQALLTRSQPSASLSDFARSQLDHALRVAGSVAAQSDEEDPDGPTEPNLQPFAALRVGEDVYTVTLPFTPEPEAVAYAPSVVRDYPGADAVAVVCDGFLRSGGERFDALLVRAQERGGERSHVFAQRYQRVDGGVSPVGDWILHGLASSLLPAAAEPGAHPPDPEAEAYAREILRELVEWMRLGADDSGAELYGEQDALVTPSLYSRIDGRTHTARFMMASLPGAEEAARATLAESPRADCAVLVCDWVATRNGRPDRSFRLRAQQRGRRHSWVFAQGYEPPQAGKRFEVRGELTLLRQAESLFP